MRTRMRTRTKAGGWLRCRGRRIAFYADAVGFQGEAELAVVFGEGALLVDLGAVVGDLGAGQDFLLGEHDEGAAGAGAVS